MKYEILTTNDLSGNEITNIIATQNDGVVLIIPTDPNNSDYQAYLKSLEGAN